MAADFNVIWDASQFATLCAKLDALTTAVNGIRLTVNNPPVDLAAITQAVKDLQFNAITIMFPSHTIRMNGRGGDIYP